METNYLITENNADGTTTTKIHLGLSIYDVSNIVVDTTWTLTTGEDITLVTNTNFNVDANIVNIKTNKLNIASETDEFMSILLDTMTMLKSMVLIDSTELETTGVAPITLDAITAIENRLKAFM